MRSLSFNGAAASFDTDSIDRSDAGVEITEQDIRNRVKAKIPRLLKKADDALLIEEMEVCRGRARVDMAVITNLLIGIEIKGPKDDVSRLPGQILAYSQCFDRVVLVVDERLAPKAIPLIPEWWGVIVGMTRYGRLTYQLKKRGEPNPALDLDSVLALLWRDEVDSLFVDLVGHSTNPRASKKAIRAELLLNVEPSILHHAGLKKLRQRTDWRSTRINNS